MAANNYWIQRFICQIISVVKYNVACSFGFAKKMLKDQNIKDKYRVTDEWAYMFLKQSNVQYTSANIQCTGQCEGFNDSQVEI